ncbi:MAG: hypothetical protein AAF620_15285 [Bacteroidota bacterium]
MNKQELKKQIEELATETDCTFIEAASAMQSASAQLGNEKVITTIGELKLESMGL